MKYVSTLLILMLVVSTRLAFSSTPDRQVSRDWQSWPTVGKAQLSWFIFDIYQSELKSPSGEYIQGLDISPHPVALSIVYQRDITSQQLLNATEEQWLNLGYDANQVEPWTESLATIFPDVHEGERLVYITDGVAGEFRFFGRERQDALLGLVQDEQLNDAFLSIWLSPSTEYPKHRAKLIRGQQ